MYIYICVCIHTYIYMYIYNARCIIRNRCLSVVFPPQETAKQLISNDIKCICSLMYISGSRIAPYPFPPASVVHIMTLNVDWNLSNFKTIGKTHRNC